MAPKITLALFLVVNLLFSTSYSSYTPATPHGHGVGGNCSIDTVQLAACVNLLNLVKLNVGDPPVEPCCSLIRNVADLEAALCLCTVVKANVLNIVDLDLPIDVSLLLNVCKKHVPEFQCP